MMRGRGISWNMTLVPVGYRPVEVAGWGGEPLWFLNAVGSRTDPNFGM